MGRGIAAKRWYVHLRIYRAVDIDLSSEAVLQTKLHGS
jgi:hypothetical protein